MSNAFIIEVGSHTAGIVARDNRSYRFFPSTAWKVASFTPRVTPNARRERCFRCGVV
jgi:hypothetical protein